MKHSLWKVLAAGSMCTSLLAGCSGTDAGTSSEAGSADLGDTVKIGLNFELSGDVSSYGNSENNGAKLAIKQFNEKADKPFTVEGVEIDDKGDAAESTTAATKLIEQDKVAGIVGPATSAASIATYAIASDSAVPVISPSATQVDATINPTTGQVYEYAWRVCFEDTYQGAAMATFAYDTLDARKAVIFNEVSDYGQGLALSFKDKFTSMGGEVVDQVSYNAKDTDFSAAITKMQGMDFDVVYIAGYYTEAGKIIKQMKDAGIDVPIVGADGFDSTELVDQAGVEYSSNIYYTTAYTLVNASDELKQFVDDYTKEYNQEPNMFSALGYDATNLLLDSLVASGKSGAELNAELEKANFSGVTGSFTFDESTHTPLKTVLVVGLTKGEQTDATEVTVE